MKASVLGMAVMLVLSLAGCAPVEEFPVNNKVNPRGAALDRVSIAMQYLQKDEIEQAQRHLQKAVESDPKSPEVYNAYGLLYEAEGDLKKAEKSYKRAISLRDDYSTARNNYGVFLFKHNRHKDACKHFERASEDMSYERRDAAFENFGRCLLKVGDKQRAEKAFQRAIRINDTLAVSTLELAALRLERGDNEQARAGYARFLELNQGRSQTARSLWLGIRLERIFGDKNALASYELALKRLYPNSEEYQQYLKSVGTAGKP